jgi:hypothetical protein
MDHLLSAYQIQGSPFFLFLINLRRNYYMLQKDYTNGMQTLMIE